MSDESNLYRLLTQLAERPDGAAFRTDLVREYGAALVTLAELRGWVGFFGADTSRITPAGTAHLLILEGHRDAA